MYDSIYNSTSLGFEDHPLRSFANDQDFNYTVGQIDWNAVLGDSTVGEYTRMTVRWVAWTLIATLIPILSSYHFLKTHVWTRFTNRTTVHSRVSFGCGWVRHIIVDWIFKKNGKRNDKWEVFWHLKKPDLEKNKFGGFFAKKWFCLKKSTF